MGVPAGFGERPTGPFRPRSRSLQVGRVPVDEVRKRTISRRIHQWLTPGWIEPLDVIIANPKETYNPRVDRWQLVNVSLKMGARILGARQSLGSHTSPLIPIHHEKMMDIGIAGVSARVPTGGMMIDPTP